MSRFGGGKPVRNGEIAVYPNAPQLELANAPRMLLTSESRVINFLEETDAVHEFYGD
jgi:hypothetical protein